MMVRFTWDENNLLVIFLIRIEGVRLFLAATILWVLLFCVICVGHYTPAISRTSTQYIITTTKWAAILWVLYVTVTASVLGFPTRGRVIPGLRRVSHVRRRSWVQLHRYIPDFVCRGICCVGVDLCCISLTAPSWFAILFLLSHVGELKQSAVKSWHDQVH